MNKGVFIFAAVTGLMLFIGGLSFWLYGPKLDLNSDYQLLDVQVDSVALGTQKRGVNPEREAPFFFEQRFKLHVHFETAAQERIDAQVEVDSILYFKDSLSSIAADSSLRAVFPKGQVLSVFSKRQDPSRLRQKRPSVIVDADRTPFRTRFGRMMTIAGALILGMGIWGILQVFQSQK